MLPTPFTERMKNILGIEYEAFEQALGEENVRAIRVNTTKIDIDDFLKKTKLQISPIEYAEDGFILENTEGIGRTPEHHAGMFYVQDPGAMATVKAVETQRGWRVLDSCAAPGGKASQLSAAIGDEGVLLANEYVPKRAKIIVSNFERLGIKNAVITSLDTKEISKMFDSYFNLVLCDAPCSGEGMFRKYDEALTEWSEENVALCAKRQNEILNNLASTVADGGYLLYSTCTYSVEENEGVVKEFLQSHKEFSLVPTRQILHNFTVSGTNGLTDARRFYPHLTKGEGQFIALMKKDENIGNLPTILYKDAGKDASRDEISVCKDFILSNLLSMPEGRIIKVGEYLVLVSHDLSIPPHSVFMSGVILGEVKKKLFFPHHQLFSAYGNLFKRKINLTSADSDIEKYLRGEEIDAKDCDNGWCCVMYEGCTLGGGKISGGRVKNHYPKGLRNN